jgi:radical SAM superfamily enzyme YgiQ (UPF0313 family)
MDAAVDVVLVNPPYQRRVGSGFVEPIGLASLAASLRAHNIPTRVLDAAREIEDRTDLVAALDDWLVDHRDVFQNASIIGLGPLVTATLQPARQIVEFARTEAPTKIVVGGPLCSAPGVDQLFPDYLDVDAYVAGDGEQAILHLWRLRQDEWGTTSLEGVGWPGGPAPQPHWIQDLDGLPTPDRSCLKPTRPSARRSMGDGVTTVAFLSRGCPYSCTFCAAPLASGRRVRRLSPPRVSAELAACHELGYKHIVFYDDCLFVRGATLDRRIRDFISAVDGSPWKGTYQLELRCDAVVAMSEDSLLGLIRTGLRQVNMGIEKSDVTSLTSIRKRLTPQTAEAACSRLREAGVRTAATFIMGGPGESRENLTSLKDYAGGLPLDFAHFNPLAIYPGTKLFDEVFPGERDWLSLCLDPEWAPQGDILWRSQSLPLSHIAEAVATAYREFYTSARLEGVLSRVPPEECDAVRAAYALLSATRAEVLTSALTLKLESKPQIC